MENDKKKSFGEFITQRRRALGLTQREFADKLFVTDSAVSKWERGLSYPDITLIRDICEILGVSEHELLTASEDVEARSAEKLAAKYRRYARNFKLAQYVLYGGAALVCLICDAADGGAFGWSLIVLASLLTAASLTLLPALVPERMGGASAALGLMASVTLLLGLICAVGGYDWFAPAALGTLFGLWLLTGPYIVRRLPLPEALKGRKASLYFSLALLLLLALLGVCCLREGGSWFLTAALGVLLGLAVVLLPFVMRQLPLPRELNRHRALVWLGVVTLLLAALIPAAGARYLWTEAYPLVLVAMAWPWALLLCIRYLPGFWQFKAAASCAVTALWIWLAPWGVQLITEANGWISTNTYDPLRPYGVDFSDWASAPTLGGNIAVTVMLALTLAAAALLALGVRRQIKTPRSQ